MGGSSVPTLRSSGLRGVRFMSAPRVEGVAAVNRSMSEKEPGAKAAPASFLWIDRIAAATAPFHALDWPVGVILRPSRRGRPP